MRLYFFLLLVGTSFYCFPQDIELSFLTLKKELLKNSNTVVRSETQEVDVSNPEFTTIKRSLIVTILNETGYENVSTHLYYDDQTQIRELELYVYDKFGNEIEKFKKRDFSDVSAADGFSLYTDDRMLYVDYKPKSYPYTLKFETEIKNKSSAFLPKWIPLRGFASSTEHSKYTIRFDPTNKPNYKPKSLSEYDVTVSEGSNTIVYEAVSLPAISYEEYAPDFLEFAPNVTFSLNSFLLQGKKGYGKSWEQFGKWMNADLLSGVSELPESTVQSIRSLVANETSNIEKARKVYQYLQDKVRYVSVQIGIGGWKPMRAEDVDRLSYGDCKALTNYTKALLDVAGVPSYYTILHSSSKDRDISEDFVAMQGNHAILGIPEDKDIVWLECTSQDLPFGHIGNKNDDRNVLIVTDEGGKIVRTKKYTEAENEQKTNATITISENGAITASLKKTSKGLQYDFVYGIPTLSEDDRIKYYKQRWGHINGLTIHDSDFENDRVSITFTENLEIEANNYLSNIGDDMLLRLNVFNRLDFIPSRTTNRKLPIQVNFGYTDVDKYTFKVPDGYMIGELPDTKTLDGPFGSYKTSVKRIDKSTLEYSRTLIINKKKHKASNYKEFRDFYKKISKLDKTKILISKHKTNEK